MAPKGKGSADKSKSKDTSTEKGASKTKGAQSINVRHILCEKHGKKEEALKKLNEGVAFNKVAEEYSEDKARAGIFFSHCYSRVCVGALADTMTGGSLGWKTKGQLLPEFENVAFALEASSTTSPKWAECKTSEGYHIVMVEGRK
jgi:NIMA-interacting peptidyl-prolyl cis-trans isomerase 4